MLIKDGVVYRTEYEQLLYLTEKMHKQEGINGDVSDEIDGVKNDITALEGKHLYLLKIILSKSNFNLTFSIYYKSHEITNIAGIRNIVTDKNFIPIYVYNAGDKYSGFLTGITSNEIHIHKFDGTSVAFQTAGLGLSVNNYIEVY